MHFRNPNIALNARPQFFDSFLLKDLFETPVVAKAAPQIPAVNISASEEAFVVSLAAPGLKKEYINIALDKDVLTISYKEENGQEKPEKHHFLKQEFAVSSFSRSFTFPKGTVDEEKIQAQYEDGILRLELPKKEEAKPKGPRQIAVS